MHTYMYRNSGVLKAGFASSQAPVVTIFVSTVQPFKKKFKHNTYICNIKFLASPIKTKPSWKLYLNN